MITRELFYKPLLSQTDEELADYLAEMQDYLIKELPLLNDKKEWDDSDCEMFDRGLILLSAFTRAGDFCLNAYRFSTSEKRVKNFLYYVTQIKAFLQGRGVIGRDNGMRNRTYRTGDAAVIGASFQAPVRTGQKGRPPHPRNVPVIASAGAKDELLRNPDAPDPLRQTLDTRPRHLHEYVHLLPEDLQQEAMKVRDYYDQMNDESHKLEVLCSDDKSSQKDRAYHASQLCHIEDKLRNLWARIDAAYAEATGSPVSEDYKQFLVEEEMRINGSVKELAPCETSKFDIDAMPDGDEKERIKAARIERNKKFLRKSDRKGDERHKQNLIDAARELHEWGIAITDSQVECCAKYGFDVPAEWIELPLEERKRQRQQARNEQRKAERAAVRAAKAAAKQAAIDEAMAPYTGGDLSVFD